MGKVVLYQPDIALNVGAIIRTVACLGGELHIIEPCGFVFDEQKIKRAAMDYYDKISGDKGIYSTTHDLLKWYESLRDGSIVSKESLREMFTPRSFEHPGLRNYGYGFRLWVDEQQRTDYVYHTGWWKGYNTIMFFSPQDDFVIILLGNKYNRTVYVQSCSI